MPHTHRVYVATVSLGGDWGAETLLGVSEEERTEQLAQFCRDRCLHGDPTFLPEAELAEEVRFNGDDVDVAQEVIELVRTRDFQTAIDVYFERVADESYTLSVAELTFDDVG